MNGGVAKLEARRVKIDACGARMHAAVGGGKATAVTMECLRELKKGNEKS
jgi:hypothetical protein